MHDQVGIAPDGRGEMRVRPQRQPEMSIVFRVIIGLLHGAQRRRVDQLVESVPRPAPAAGSGAGSAGPALGQRKTRGLGHLAQRIQFSAVGSSWTR